MLDFKERKGNHQVYSYDTTVFNFKAYLEEIYNCPIDQLLTMAKEWEDKDMANIESDLHKRFYTSIKSDDRYKDIYCRFVQEIYQTFFPEEPFLIYQSFPSIRLQYPNNVAIPPHCDSDSIGCHPLGEKNFLVPITIMKNSTSLFIQETPGSSNDVSFELDYGDLLYFNGNTCIHYNKTNTENYIRVSFDFRVILSYDYCSYVLRDRITLTNPRDPDKQRKPVLMIAGGYYQLAERDCSMASMKNWYSNHAIVQSRPLFEQEEKGAIYQYLSEGDPFITEFARTAEFEASLCELTGAKHCFMVTSGTAALIAALYACSIERGDEVIVPNYTMIATANAVKAVGATPVYVDVDSKTYTLSPEIVAMHLTPRTKAVIHVSLNNYHTGLVELANLCKEKGIYMIEDAAQSVGQCYRGKHLGTFGDIGCFSFSTPKIISTGQGGAVVTDSDTLARRVKCIKNFGRKDGAGGIEEYECFGLNFKVTDLQAVIGIEQLKKVPGRRLRLREMYDRYYQRLSAYMKPPLDEDWFPWFITIEIDNRSELETFLKKHNIQTRPCYPLPCNKVTTPWATHIAEKGLFLPTHFLLTDREIDYISQLIELYIHTKDKSKSV